MTGDSLQLFSHCVPPTLPSPSWEGLNTTFSMKQGIGRRRNWLKHCCNCGISSSKFVYAQVQGLFYASYWCSRCYLYFHDTGQIRPPELIKKKSTPRPTRCPDCKEPLSKFQGPLAVGLCTRDLDMPWMQDFGRKAKVRESSPSSQDPETTPMPQLCFRKITHVGS